MIDHTGVTVSDFDKSKRFYSEALKPIGYQLLLEFPASVTGRTDVAGFGEPPKADFWIAEGTPNEPRIHVANALCPIMPNVRADVPVERRIDLAAIEVLGEVAQRMRLLLDVLPVLFRFLLSRRKNREIRFRCRGRELFGERGVALVHGRHRLHVQLAIFFARKRRDRCLARLHFGRRLAGAFRLRWD